MKKVLAILLLVCMALSLGVNAFADVEGGDTTTKGSITISNVTKGKTYKLYKIFDATLDPGSDDVYISYTYSGSKWEENNYFAKDSYNYITIKDGAADTNGYLTQAAVVWLAKLKENAVREVTAEDNTNVLVFDNLDYGYYYVESSLGTAVSVNSTKPDVSVIDKNQGPSWTNPEETDPAKATLGKYILQGTAPNVTRVSENSVSFGDKVRFEVSFNATNYKLTKKVLTYFLTDTIADGFAIDKNSLQVEFDGVLKTEGPDYTVEFRNNDKEFIISAPWVDAGGTFKNHANVIFRVTYEATLLTNAVIASTGNKNTAFFDYRMEGDTLLAPAGTDAPDTPPASGSTYHKSEEKYTYTFTYAMGLTKIDGADKHKLSGAKFSVYKGTNTTPISAAATSTAGIYDHAVGTGTVTEFETDSNGMLIVNGLADGTYRLVETKAPNGYNRNTAETTFTFVKDDIESYVQSYTTYYDENGSISESETTTSVAVNYGEGENVLNIIYENEHGVALPITGGMGTTVFYVLGGGLIFVAVLLLITKKRMHSEK